VSSVLSTSLIASAVPSSANQTIASRFVVDTKTPALDLGTPAPAVVNKNLLVAKDKHDELILSKQVGESFEPIATPWEEVSKWPVTLASGSKTHAYWLSGTQLVRREVFADGTAGPKTIVATDIASNSPIAAARSLEHPNQSTNHHPGGGQLDVVVYIASESTDRGEHSARIWIEGQGSLAASQAAGGATSVTLLPVGPRRFLVCTLDGRLGMSPIHSIALDLDEQGRAILGEDRVVYVAGPAERQSKLTAVWVEPGPVVLLPISKSTIEFGTLVLRVGIDEENPTWVDYPNGLDPAPLATATVCDQPMVAFVRPETSAVDATKVLELGWLDAQGMLRDRQVIANHRAITHVSLSSLSTEHANHQAKRPASSKPGG